MTDRTHTHPLTGEVNLNPVLRPFAAWLQELAQGKTHDELTEALWDLNARVRETGKKGTLTVAFTLDPKTAKGIVVVTDEIKLKLPSFPRTPSIFFDGADGNLTRTNPYQDELPTLKPVPTEQPTDSTRQEHTA